MATSCARKASALKQTLRIARQPLAVAPWVLSREHAEGGIKLSLGARQSPNYTALVLSASMRATMASITADFACPIAAPAKSIAKAASRSSRSA